VYIIVNVKLHKPHKIWCKTGSHPTNSHCIVTLLVLRATWWWPTYKAETCSCILQSVAYYIVIPSENLLCFWLHIYVSIYVIDCIMVWCVYSIVFILTYAVIKFSRLKHVFHLIKIFWNALTTWNFYRSLFRVSYNSL
jgi:hypothetical protein